VNVYLMEKNDVACTVNKTDGVSLFFLIEDIQLKATAKEEASETQK